MYITSEELQEPGTSVSDKLEEVFNLTPVKKAEVVQKEIPQDLDGDIQRARQIHHKLLEKSEDALDNLIDFAKASESPRAFEVVSNLIKTTSEVAKTLVELNSAKKEEPTVQNNTQNNLFVGSTAELQKLIKDGKIDR